MRIKFCSLSKCVFLLLLLSSVSGCDIESLINLDDDDFYYDDEKSSTRELGDNTLVSESDDDSETEKSKQSEQDSYEDKVDRMKEITPYDVVERMDTAGSYDLIGGYEPISKTAVQRAMVKWANGNTNVVLRDYKSHTVEIRKTLGDTGLQEMRIKFIQNPSGASLNRRVTDILNEIADAETIETCGVNAKPLIIYNKPSFEVKQPTSFYKPEIVRSQYIREYAYRCLY